MGRLDDHRARSRCACAAATTTRSSTRRARSCRTRPRSSRWSASATPPSARPTASASSRCATSTSPTRARASSSTPRRASSAARPAPSSAACTAGEADEITEPRTPHDAARRGPRRRHRGGIRLGDVRRRHRLTPLFAASSREGTDAPSVRPGTAFVPSRVLGVVEYLCKCSSTRTVGRMNDELSATFAALADPTRRAILERLSQGEATIGELAEPFDAQPARDLPAHHGARAGRARHQAPARAAALVPHRARPAAGRRGLDRPLPVLLRGALRPPRRVSSPGSPHPDGARAATRHRIRPTSKESRS